MRARSSILALTAMALLAGGGSAALAKASKDQMVPTGETRDCLGLNQIKSTHIWDDSTIDFRVGSETWRNILPNSCPSLGSEKRYAFQTSTSNICSLDTITVLYSSGPGLMRGATCGLGKFQKVAKPAP